MKVAFDLDTTHLQTLDYALRKIAFGLFVEKRYADEAKDLLKQLDAQTSKSA